MKARKHAAPLLLTTLTASAASGATPAVSLLSFDAVVILANFTTITAGSITLVPELSSDGGTTWHPIYGGSGATAYSSGAIATAGARAIQIPGPLGVLFRVTYTIATGPVTGTIHIEPVKTGLP